MPFEVGAVVVVVAATEICAGRAGERRGGGWWEGVVVETAHDCCASLRPFPSLSRCWVKEYTIFY